MMWGFYGLSWWWMLLGAICMVIFWGAVIWLVVWVASKLPETREEVLRSVRLLWRLPRGAWPGVRSPAKSSKN